MPSRGSDGVSSSRCILLFSHSYNYQIFIGHVCVPSTALVLGYKDIYKTVLALQEVTFWGQSPPQRAKMTTELSLGMLGAQQGCSRRFRLGFLEVMSELSLKGKAEVSQEEGGWSLEIGEEQCTGQRT